ncbi:hypothetical protein [Methanolobus vulcani]|uniref:hypothetical protein n=1 Tax=Methanolobus vulcani TaxID=38026 RepID=UPI000B227D79|nr:hypothetical protein [Methanolobus vulcani]
MQTNCYSSKEDNCTGQLFNASNEVRIEHSNYLEWIIIVLIAIEIVMEKVSYV